MPRHRVTPQEIAAAAQAAGIDPDLYSRQVRQESGGQINIVSPKGAMGPAQLMPDTARGLGVDPNDPNQNLAGGARYLKSLLDQFGGDKALALAAYNAGPHAVIKHGGIPPYPETQAYVQNVLNGQPVAADTTQSGADIFGLDGGSSRPQAQGGKSGADIFGLNSDLGTPDAPPTLDPALNRPLVMTRGNAKPTPEQTQAANFLSANGFYDPNAAEGSSQYPLAETPGSGPPKKDGTWYITTSGALRMAGNDNPDFLPSYQQLVANQHNAEMNPVSSRFGAGMKQGIGDVAGSLQRALPSFAAPMSGAPGIPDMNPQRTQDTMAATRQGFEQRRNQFDLLRPNDPWAQGGRVAGQLAATLPAMAAGEGALGALGAGVTRAAPAAGPVVDFLGGRLATNGLVKAGSMAARGAAQGAEASALTSSTSDIPLPNQMLSGAAMGGALGVGFPLVMKGARGAVKALAGSAATPEVAALAKTAMEKYGIPLRSSQIEGVGNRSAAIRDSEMIGKWGTGYGASNAAQLRAITKAVAGTFGENADALTPQVMQRAKTRIGRVMNDVASRTDITDMKGLAKELGAVLNDARQVLPGGEVAPLENQIKAIGSTASQTGRISGKSYMALTAKGSPLDRATESANPNLRYYAQKIENALHDALENAALGDDAAALQSARWQYKNLMTVKNLAAKADVQGNIPIRLLEGAVNTSFKNRAFQGAGDLGELAQIVKTFVKEPPNSGTAPRLADKLKGMVLPAAASGGAVMAIQNPGLAAKLAAGAAALGATKMASNVVGGVVNNNALRTGVALGKTQLPAGARKALGDFEKVAGPRYVPAAIIGGRPVLSPPRR